MKLYFQKDDECCHPKEWHLDFMRDNLINEMEVFEAKIERGTGYFFCKEFQEVGQVGDGCGRMCEKYKPLNGKNGRCKSSGYVYEQTEKTIILTLS